MHFWRIMLPGWQYKIYKSRRAHQFVSWYLMEWTIFHKYKLIFSQLSSSFPEESRGNTKDAWCDFRSLWAPGRKFREVMTKTVRRNFCGTQQAVFRWKTPWRACAAAFSPWLSACSFPAESLELPGLSMHESKRGTQRKERQKTRSWKICSYLHSASIENRGGFGHFGVNTAESGRNGTGGVFWRRIFWRKPIFRVSPSVTYTGRACTE